MDAPGERLIGGGKGWVTNEKKGERGGGREKGHARDHVKSYRVHASAAPLFNTSILPPLMPLRVCEFPVASATVVRDKNRARSSRKGVIREKQSPPGTNVFYEGLQFHPLHPHSSISSPKPRIANITAASKCVFKLMLSRALKKSLTGAGETEESPSKRQ